MGEIKKMYNAEVARYDSEQFLLKVLEESKLALEECNFFKAGFFEEMYISYSKEVDTTFELVNVDCCLDIYYEWLEELQITFECYRNKPSFWWYEKMLECARKEESE